MTQGLQSQAKMDSKNNCGVCGTPLIYGTDSKTLRCLFCGTAHSTQIYCPEGHYICDSCHASESLMILRQVLNTTASTAPSEILERVMSHPAVPMHGPEHHAIVPAAIIAAVRNAGYPIPEDAIEKAVTRGAKVPGGWCGSHGVCGAAIGVGIAVSVLTEATPLTGRQRSMAIEATSFTLSRIVDGHPRCCKRASRRALEAAVEFLRDRMNIIVGMGQHVKCTYSERNKECPGETCPYHSSTAGNGSTNV